MIEVGNRMIDTGRVAVNIGKIRVFVPFYGSLGFRCFTLSIWIRDEERDAIRDLNLATQFGPGSGLYHFHLAIAYQGSDNRAVAKKAPESAKMNGLASSIREPLEKLKYEKLLSWLNK